MKKIFIGIKTNTTDSKLADIYSKQGLDVHCDYCLDDIAIADFIVGGDDDVHIIINTKSTQVLVALVKILCVNNKTRYNLVTVGSRFDIIYSNDGDYPRRRINN